MCHKMSFVDVLEGIQQEKHLTPLSRARNIALGHNFQRSAGNCNCSQKSNTGRRRHCTLGHWTNAATCHRRTGAVASGGWRRLYSVADFIFSLMKDSTALSFFCCDIIRIRMVEVFICMWSSEISCCEPARVSSISVASLLQ